MGASLRLMCTGLLATAAIVAGTPASQAASHREAPFISGLPRVDGTDFYMFRSYEAGRSDYVTLIADYVPFQIPYGGPNFFQLDSNAVYEIHVDNNGDAVEDVTFQFRFNNVQRNLTVPAGGKNVAVPLINIGALSSADANGDAGVLNVRETYTLTVVRGNRRGSPRQAVSNAADGSTTFVKPTDNIGQKSIPN